MPSEQNFRDIGMRTFQQDDDEVHFI